MGGTTAGALAALHALDGVGLRVDGETIPVTVADAVHEDRRVRVVAVERGGDRRLLVRTEWAGGWLDPVVDVARDGGPFEPAGSLDAVLARPPGATPTDRG